MINAIPNTNSTELIAKAMLAYCYNSTICEYHIDYYLKTKIAQENQMVSGNYLKLAFSALRLAAGIIILRGKYGEKAEPIVRQIYKEFTDISFSDEFADVGMVLACICKWYSANWVHVPAENDLLPTKDNELTRALLPEFLLTPISEYPHNIEITDVLCTLIKLNINTAQTAVNILLMQVERDRGYVPSF